MKRMILFLVLVLIAITFSGCSLTSPSYVNDKTSIGEFQETPFTSSLTINGCTLDINVVRDPLGFLWYAIADSRTNDRQLIPFITEDGHYATEIKTSSNYEPADNSKIFLGEFQVTEYTSSYTINDITNRNVIVKDPMGHLWYAIEYIHSWDWQLVPLLTKDGRYATEIPDLPGYEQNKRQ